MCVKERESESRPEKEAPNDPLVTWVVCNSDGGAKTPEICNRREREIEETTSVFDLCADVAQYCMLALEIRKETKSQRPL